MEARADGARGAPPHRLRTLALGAAAGVGTLVLLRVAEGFGVNIPYQDAVARDYVVGVLWALALGAGILLWPVPAAHKLDLLVLWGVKCLVTLGFMLLYEYQYATLDAYGYYTNVRMPGIKEVGSGGSEVIVALATLQDRWIPRSYHALKVSCSMLGLIGVYLFFRAGVLFTGRTDRRIFYLLGLFPSILFWSSILGKDPIVLLGLGMYAYGVMGWLRTRRWGSLLWLGAGIVVAATIRFWLVPILVFAVLVAVWWGIRRPMARLAFAATTLLVSAAMVAYLAARLGIGSPGQVLVAIETVSQAWAQGGSAQEVPVDLGSVQGVLLFLPLGAFTALFRPLPGEIMNPFGLLAGLENLALLGLLLVAVVRLRTAQGADPAVVWAVAFVCAWASIYGFISYQNLGTGVRFKLQVLPVLVGLLLHLSRKRTAPGVPAASP